MTPEIGKTYIGPAGLRFKVLEVKGTAHSYQRVVIQREDGGGGRIEFPLHDAAKWLEDVP
jgi:hypothetical protein